MIWFFIAILVVYLFLSIVSLVGLVRTKVFKSDNKQKNSTKVSVIIALRNEENNIPNLLNCFLSQTYPKDLVEYILVNDHSTDKTLELLKKYENDFNNFPFTVLDLNDVDGYGKKTAITKAISLSKGELIVTTDADCTMQSNWIRTIVSFYETYRPKMILSTVTLNGKNSLFGDIQSLELMSLMIATCGSAFWGYPILANGANLAYTKEAFEICKGYKSNIRFASGDDMFLMMSVRKIFGKKAIHFLRSEQTIVDTPSEINLKRFINQRIRWISKSTGFKSLYVKALSLVFLIFNLSILLILLLSIFNSKFLLPAIGIIILKIISDTIILSFQAKFENRLKKIFLTPLYVFYNIIYLIVVGIASFFKGFVWKDRVYK